MKNTATPLILLLGLLISPCGHAQEGATKGDRTPAAAQTATRPDGSKAGKSFTPRIPKTWDEAGLAGFETPLAGVDFEAQHVSPAFYYSIPVRKIYKSYPVYAPGREPDGYLDWLRRQEPEIAFDASGLETEEDWIRAGELVFDAPIGYNGLGSLDKLRDPDWYEKGQVPVAADGTVPFFRYVIREKGTIDVGEFSCGTCHTRVLPDGQVIKGAQGNFPLEHLDDLTMHSKLASYDSERLAKVTAGTRRFTRRRYAAPWVDPDPLKPLETMSYDEIASAYGRIPPGVQARLGSSIFSPVQVPDLIGLEHRRYFDRTGRIRHHDIGDLMRYAALTAGLAGYVRYGHFIPSGEIPEKPRPHQRRFSDAQLYALSLYLYSLKPPANPNPFDEKAALGKKLFHREECDRCHRPPLYTNNKLTPVDGFTVPEDHPDKESIVPFSVGTDPALALTTRRGTGFYKVPSLLGVWYRGPLEHNGSVATLEDWFDPRRRRDDYVPTGWLGPWGVEKRAVPGHKFGLDLTPREREALLAFLRTL